MKKPERHWVRGDNGWQSHDRSRCDPESECAEILCPPDPLRDKDGNERPWQLRDVSLLLPAPKRSAA